MKAEFQVRQDLSSWNGHKPGQLIEVNEASAVALVAAAESAGMLVNVQYDSDGEEVRILTVEHDSDSLKRQVEAQFSGTWQAGNVAQFEIDHSPVVLGEEVEAAIEEANV